jgi:hypothetical protein
MTMRRVRLRVQHAGCRLKDRAYAGLATLWPGPLSPQQQEYSQRLFHWLVDQETTARTPLEEILLRLPEGLATAIRHELGLLLAADEGRKGDTPPGSNKS